MDSADAAKNLNNLVADRLRTLSITSRELDERAKSLAYREPDRFFRLSIRWVRMTCEADFLYHGMVRLTEREYNTLIAILWDRNKDAFERDTGIAIDAYSKELSEERKSRVKSTPRFDDPGEYWEWRYEQRRQESLEEQRELRRQEERELRQQETLELNEENI